MRKTGHVLAGLCAAGALAALCLPVSNPDVFWHLSAGRWMAENLALPRADWLSQTMAGQPWSDFEWLVQVLWHLCEKAGGIPGLWALKVAVLSGAAFALWRALDLRGLPPEARGIGVLAWALGLSSANDIRPENFSILFFLLLWLALERRRLSNAGKPLLSRKEAVSLALLFAVWANMHAGFLYGLILVGIYSAAAAARGRRWEPALAPLLCAAAALANPYFLDVYRVPFEHWAALGDLKSYIVEWKEPSIFSVWLWPFWGLVAAAFGAVLVRHLSHRDVPIEHLAALVFFGLSAAAHVRTSVYFISVAVPVTASVFAAYRFADKRPAAGRALLAAGFLPAWFFFVTVGLSGFRNFEFFQPVNVPVKLTRFLESEREVLGGRTLLNPWHWGGYLGYRLYPDYRVFVDGRYIFHPLLKPLYSATRSGESYGEFLDRRGVEVAALRRARQFTSMPFELRDGKRLFLLRPFYVDFLPRERWAMIYWGDEGMVFVRREAFPEEWVREREFTHFRPDDLSAAFLRVREGAVELSVIRREVERYVALGGDEAAAGFWLETARKAAKE